LEDLRKAGYDAAARKKQMLERYSLSESDWAAYQAYRRSRRRTDAIRADSIEIVGDIAPRRAEALVALCAKATGRSWTAVPRE